MGGGLGYALYTASHSVVLAVLLGLPLFLIVLGVPLTFIEGVWAVFESSTWTLTYRAVVAPQAVG